MAATDPLLLIVTDDATLRAELVEATRARGIRIQLAKTGREALEALERLPLSAMVIDSAVPPMGGFDVAKTVRSQAGSAAPAMILLTDVRWSPSQKGVAIQQLGLTDILSKPIVASEVAEIVHGALPGWAAEPDAPLADAASHDERRQVEQEMREVEQTEQGGPDSPGAASARKKVSRGNLQSTPFPDLLHQLYTQRATGALFLLKDNIKKIIYFQGGHAVYVKSNLLGECLGEVLVSQGTITEQQCRDSLRHMRESRRQQGTILVDMGVITPQQLVIGLEQQLSAKLLEVFAWTRGEYLFKEDSRVPAEVVTLRMSTASLIADGVRSRWSEERIQRAVDPFLDTFLVTTSNPKLRFQELSLDEHEQRLRDELDGSKTLREVLGQSPLATRRAATVAYILLATGMVEPRAQRRVEPAPEQPPRQDDETHTRHWLAAELVSLRKRPDPFAVLGVSVAATDAELERAYAGLARQYHPDRFRRFSQATCELAEEIFLIVYSAYQEVASIPPQRRMLAQMATSEFEAVNSSAGRGLQIERVVQRAEQLIEEKKWAAARTLLEAAAREHSDSADLLVLFGWATFCGAPDEAIACRDAVRAFRRAIELSPRDYRAYLYLGRVYVRLGKHVLAEKQFEKALQCNPNSSEALRELQGQQQRPTRRPTEPQPVVAFERPATRKSRN